MVLATWMALVGPFPTLFVAKGVAAGGGILLSSKGIHRTLALLTLLYALAPWFLDNGPPRPLTDSCLLVSCLLSPAYFFTTLVTTCPSCPTTP